jgi:TorA maturation chaperone TorD
VELFRALGSLAEPPSPETRRLAELLELGPPPDSAAYSDLFLFQLYPYASVYLGVEGQLGGEARDRIAGFWRALGESPPAEPDHLAVMLALYARLAELEKDATDRSARVRWRHARHAFLQEHLLTWLPPFLAKLQEVAPPFYRAWGALLEEGLSLEAAQLEEQDDLPLHLRQSSPLADPRSEGHDAFLDSLLAPVRSGCILIRFDLQQAAQQLELGSRIGERRFALKSLLQQNAGALLDWLRQQAVSWSDRHLQRPWGGRAVARFWSERSKATADLLAELHKAL